MIVVIAAIFYTNIRLDKIEVANSRQGKIIQMNRPTFQTSINIDKVAGNGNVFGDNNTIENKSA